MSIILAQKSIASDYGEGVEQDGPDGVRPGEREDRGLSKPLGCIILSGSRRIGP